MNRKMATKLTNLMVVAVLSVVAPVIADELIMVRSQQKFPETMLTLQTSVKEHGYNITRVQRIDVGLTGMGYKTDKYRVVFVGKPDEIHYLVKKHPNIIPYMPPKVSIFAENDETVLVTANPNIYAELVNEEDRVIFRRWASDIRSVFDDVRNADD